MKIRDLPDSSKPRERFYFDTSIWFDFFENRNEPKLPKGKFAKELIKKISRDKNKIIVSEVVKNEYLALGYLRHETELLFASLKHILVFIYSNKKQFGKAKDLAKKRKIPLLDALHAILARDNRAIMVTRDKHFDKLRDITKSKKPEDLI